MSPASAPKTHRVLIRSQDASKHPRQQRSRLPCRASSCDACGRHNNYSCRAAETTSGFEGVRSLASRRTRIAAGLMKWKAGQHAHECRLCARCARLRHNEPTQGFDNRGDDEAVPYVERRRLLPPRPWRCNYLTFDCAPQWGLQHPRGASGPDRPRGLRGGASRPRGHVYAARRRRGERQAGWGAKGLGGSGEVFSPGRPRRLAAPAPPRGEGHSIICTEVSANRWGSCILLASSTPIEAPSANLGSRRANSGRSLDQSLQRVGHVSRGGAMFGDVDQFGRASTKI